MKVLAVGAHPDDIELGCAGTLLAHRARGDQIAMLVLSRGERGPQGVAARTDEQESAARWFGATLHWGNYPDGSVDSGRGTVALVEHVIATSGADTVYVHVPRNSHQDHRAAAKATLAAARRMQRVLLYESPSTQSFSPSLFVDVDRYLDDKLAVLSAHESQAIREWPVALEAVKAQARYHGFQARIRHAEAFETSRMVWDLPLSDALANKLGVPTVLTVPAL